MTALGVFRYAMYRAELALLEHLAGPLNVRATRPSAANAAHLGHVPPALGEQPGGAS